MVTDSDDNTVTLRDAIMGIPGEYEWKDRGDTFLGLSKRLTDAGIPEQEVYDILCDAYGEVANMFGC